jgi:hypothetical protein
MNSELLKAGGFICTTISSLKDGQAILDSDGNLRLRVDSDSYIIRAKSGVTTLHKANEWPSKVVGKKMMIKLIMEAIQ